MLARSDLPTRLRLRLWLVNHFKVLPTDPRYRALNDDQIELLFSSFLQMPTEEQWKSWYARQKREERLDLPVDELKGMGYTDADIEKIKKELAERE